jgi:DNA-binding PadR family transcriptional regulator
MNILTRNEETLLIAIWSLGDNAYGVTIMEKFQEITGRKIVFGTLYNSLGKLEKKGYVENSIGDPTPERGGKRKIFYVVSSKGMAALRQTRKFQMALWNAVSGSVPEPENHEK